MTELRPGRLSRWKLTEPVRLYVYGWGLALLLVALVAGAVSGYWLGPVIVAATLLLLVPGVEAARLSVYSPRSTVQTAMRARQ